MSKRNIKSTFFGSILSDGSFHFRIMSNPHLQHYLNFKSIDPLNHSVWTGQRPKEQTEISVFINRLSNK